MPKGIYKRTKYHLKKIRDGSKKRRSYLGENNPSYKGRIGQSNGYIRIFKPNHPNSSKQGYILEHRLIIEKNIDRLLKKDEHIHHINGIKDDNRIENLMLFSSNREHKIYETPTGENNPAWKGGKPKCSICKKKITRKAKNCKKHKILNKRNTKGQFIWHLE